MDSVIGSGRVPMVHLVNGREASPEEFDAELNRRLQEARKRKAAEDTAALRAFSARVAAESNRVAHLERRLRIVSAENRRLKDVLSNVAAAVAEWKE